MPESHMSPANGLTTESSEILSGQEPSPTGLPKRANRSRISQADYVPPAVGRKSPHRLEKARELAIACARIGDDNRGRDILVLDLRSATSLVDYFVIVTTSSRRQSVAIASEIDAEMKRQGEVKLGREGTEEGRWVLVDYGDFVVHVFSEDARTYYSLENIWGDAPRVDWVDPNRPQPRAPLQTELALEEEADEEETD